MARRKVKFDFDPFEIAGVSKRKIMNVEEVLEDVEDYVITQVLSKVGDSVSPVSGQGRFRGLSKEYKEFKASQGAGTKANLELDGDLLNSLKVEFVKGGKLRLTVDEDQVGKADGHNNFSGKSRLPRRAFIPDESKKETFKKDILSGIRSVVRSVAEEDDG